LKVLKIKAQDFLYLKPKDKKRQVFFELETEKSCAAKRVRAFD
jgi:hypothetical protein